MTIIIWLLSILTVAAFLLLMWCCMVLAKQADEESEACFDAISEQLDNQAAVAAEVAEKAGEIAGLAARRRGLRIDRQGAA